MSEEEVDRLKGLVANGQVNEVFQELIQSDSTGLHHYPVLVLQNDWPILHKLYLRGFYTTEEFQKQKNALLERLLKLIHSFHKDAPSLAELVNIEEAIEVEILDPSLPTQEVLHFKLYLERTNRLLLITTDGRFSSKTVATRIAEHLYGKGHSVEYEWHLTINSNHISDTLRIDMAGLTDNGYARLASTFFDDFQPDFNVPDALHYIGGRKRST
ncbi:MAG: hypothetical protein AAF731_20770 [Bacteroidota bacterium]